LKNIKLDKVLITR